MMEPLTVLMAVRNGEPFLQMAMDSILAQSYRAFRVLIVDDASTDLTRDIVRAYSDRRIELLCLERNVGQTAALNIGLRHASTPWIARMDADDFSAPNRLERQMQAVAEDRVVRCVGTGVWEFQDDPREVVLTKTRPQEHAEIKRAALCGSGMIHGSIVVDRAALLDVGAFDERYRYASDREMFLRFLDRYRAMNLSAPLLGLRRHTNQDSFSLGAANEYIEIFERCLADARYTAEERAILRSSLAFSHLFRARCLRRQGAYGAWTKDVAQALRLSPRTWMRNALGTLSARMLPGRLRAPFRNQIFLERSAETACQR